jgi:hypothetical protein
MGSVAFPRPLEEILLDALAHEKRMNKPARTARIMVM